jgi:peroxiredoxin
VDLAFDGTAIFGGPRSKRYVLEVEDGKVKAMHVEPDNTGLDGKHASLPQLSMALICISVSSGEGPRLGGDQNAMLRR